MGNKITGHKDSGIFEVLDKRWQSNLPQAVSTVALLVDRAKLRLSLRFPLRHTQAPLLLEKQSDRRVNSLTFQNNSKNKMIAVIIVLKTRSLHFQESYFSREGNN